MDVIMFLILFTLLAWLGAWMSVSWAIYASKTPDDMIRFMLKDTYAMILVGMSLWLWMPDVSWVLLLLTLRTMWIARMDWSLIHSRYDEIKRQLDKTG